MLSCVRRCPIVTVGSLTGRVAEGAVGGWGQVSDLKDNVVSKACILWLYSLDSGGSSIAAYPGVYRVSAGIVTALTHTPWATPLSHVCGQHLARLTTRRRQGTLSVSSHALHTPPPAAQALTPRRRPVHSMRVRALCPSSAPTTTRRTSFNTPGSTSPTECSGLRPCQPAVPAFHTATSAASRRQCTLSVA